MKTYNTSTCNIRFLAEGQGWWAKGREPTHLLLDGGCLHVPMNTKNRFLEILGENMDANVKNYIAERRTPVFVMHADLDILEHEGEMTLERFTAWAKEIQFVIKEFFHEATPNYKCGIRDKLTGRSFDRLSMLVCMAPSKTVEKDKELWTKTGIHLIKF